MLPDLKVVCNICNEPVEIHFPGNTEGWEEIEVEIDPCKKCLKQEDARGYNRGYKEAYQNNVLDYVEGEFS